MKFFHHKHLCNCISRIVFVITIFLCTQNETFGQKCPIAYYPFSGNAQDVSGNNLHGVVNGAQLIPDKNGNINSAYSFDGIDDYIQVAHSTLLNFGPNDDYSISLWIKTDVNQEDVTSNKRNFILCKWDDYNSNTYGFPFDVRITNQSYSINGQIFSYRRGLVSCNQLSETKSNSKVNDNKWHHIVTVKQNAQLKLYVDGNLEYTNTDITTCNTGNTFEMYMGKKGGTWVPGFYKGYLDEVMIFSCALSNNTIDSLFNPASHTPTEVVYSIEICKDDSVLLEANINGPFKWLLEKSPVILSNDSFIKVSPLRKTTYVLTNNINDTTRFIITVDSIEDVFLGNDTTICFGKVLLLGPLPIYDSIEWWDGSNKKINVIKKTGTYSVTVLKGECSSSDSISVEFEDCDTNFILPNPVIPDCRISIPNSFTPNGDTLNEFFAPVIYCDLKKYRLLIYNRWGDLIFESFSIYDGWDGTFKNVQVPSDTYAYLIKFTTIHGASGHKTGLLYLIR